MSAPPTSPGLLIGAVLDRVPGRKYQSTLRFAELGFRAPLPRPATLASARKSLPEGFALALRAPRNSVVSELGALRPTAQLEAGLAWVLAAADALQARAVVFRTPAELTPGARSRELLRAYVARLPQAPQRSYVWVPSGVWEPEDSAALCAELGLVCGFDPLESPRPRGPIAYATLRALGHRTGFSVSAMTDALERVWTDETREAFLSVDAERGFDVARRITQLLASAEIELAGDSAPSRLGYGGAGYAADEAEGELDDEDADDEPDDEDADDEDADDGSDDEDADDEPDDEDADDEPDDEDADDGEPKDRNRR